MKRFLSLTLLTFSLALAQPNAYTVQPGDTLTRIAARFGVSVSELVNLNNLANPNALEVGQVLTLVPNLTLPDPLSPRPFDKVTLEPANGHAGAGSSRSRSKPRPIHLYARAFLGVDYDLAPIPASTLTTFARGGARGARASGGGGI